MCCVKQGLAIKLDIQINEGWKGQPRLFILENG